MPRVTDWAGITRRDGGYYVKVEVRPIPAKGKRFKAGAPLAVMQKWRDDTRKGLEKKRDRRAAYGTGTLADDVKTYFTLWGDDQHPQTVAQRRRHLDAWVAAFPNRTRESLTTAEIEAQLAAWQRTPPETDYRKGVRRSASEGAATWAKRRQALLQLFAVLGRGTDLHNPVEDVPTRTQPEAQARGLPYPVIRELLEVMPDSATRARLGVMAFTGLRPEELRRLLPADIDHANATLYVRTAKGGAVATVPLVPEAVTWLRDLAVRRPYRPKKGKVVMRDGFGPFTSAPMNLSLQRTVSHLNAERHAAKLPPLPAGITAYSMRHSYGTALYRATRDLKTVAEGMRNSLAMAERYVEGAVSEVLERGVAKLAEALAATQTATQTATHRSGNVEKTGANAKGATRAIRPPGQRASGRLVRNLKNKR